MTPRAEHTHGSRWRATAAVLPAVVPVVLVVGVGGVTVVLQSLGLVLLVGRPELSTAAFTAPGSTVSSSASPLAGRVRGIHRDRGRGRARRRSGGAGRGGGSCSPPGL